MIPAMSLVRTAPAQRSTRSRMSSDTRVTVSSLSRSEPKPVRSHSALAFGLWLRRRRPFSIDSAAALAGVLFLVCLALARASSQHRVDAFLAAPAAFGLRWRAVLELLGIAAVGFAAAVAASSRRRRPR